MPRKLTPLKVAKQAAEYLQIKVANLEQQLTLERQQRAEEKKKAVANSAHAAINALEYLGMVASANAQVAATIGALAEKVMKL